MKNKYLIIIGIVFIGILVFIITTQDKDNVAQAQVEESLEKKNDSDEITKVKVDIKGAVKKPGVYSVDSNKRVIDVIKLSGGLKSNANTNYINLSAKVKDEMVIWIYTSSEIKKMKLESSSSEYMIKSCNCPVVDNTACISNSNSNKKGNTSNSNNSNNIVNINTASIEELITLDGIGESKAKSIIDYRNKNGNFSKVEDIMNVSGIGESAYNKIKDHITV